MLKSSEPEVVMLATQTLANLPELTVEQAEHWIAAALAEARAMRQHECQLWASSSEPAEVRRAEQLHAVWRKWAEDAKGLLQRVRPLLDARRHVAGVHDLDYAIARVLAMVKIPPADMLKRENQVRRGEVVTMEEVRRELRAARGG
jgi:hypothetical protein